MAIDAIERPPVTPRPSAQVTKARPDANRDEIASAFRKLGFSVWVKTGPLDLIVAKEDRTFLVEVKDGSKPPSQQKLTRAEAEFIQGWEGEVFVVRTVSDIKAVNHFEMSIEDSGELARAGDCSSCDDLRAMRAEVAHIRSTPIEVLVKEGKVKR